MTQRETLSALSAYFHQYIYFVCPSPIPRHNSNCYKNNVDNNSRSKQINRSDTSKYVQRTTIDLRNTVLQRSHTHMSKVWLIFNIDWRRNCRLLLTFHTSRQRRAAAASSADIRQKQQRLSSARLRPENECKGCYRRVAYNLHTIVSERTNHINWTGRVCRMVWHFTSLLLFASWKV